MSQDEADQTAVLAGLPAFCPAHVPPWTGPLPAGVARLAARNAYGAAVTADPGAPLPGLPPATWAIEAWSADGTLLADELAVVGEHQGRSPVMGFASSYAGEAARGAITWLRALRCTVVQAYDWMASYSRPLPDGGAWHDPLGRPVELRALRELVSTLAGTGAVTAAYAPVYAADPAFAAKHQDWRLYRSDREPQCLGNLLEIMNPANPDWQRHWIRAHREALEAIGFTGLHLDTYGYPRAPADRAGQPVPMRPAYQAFLAAIAAAFPAAVVSFNQVNGVPSGVGLASPRRFRYVEVWPPNDQWRHLEGLISRSAGAGREPVVLAIYPPVWSAERGAALRTVLLTEAIVTTLGAGLLVWGDDGGALRHPYYPDYEQLTEPERRTVLRWHRFALRHRDLFDPATDTSWLEIGDENGSVAVHASVRAAPEPVGGAIFARVSRRDDLVAVSVIDLTGSQAGRWDQPTRPPAAGTATVDVLVDQPDAWTAQVAVQAEGGGRFRPVPVTPVGHREGTALRITIPLHTGWAIARFGRT